MTPLRSSQAAVRRMEGVAEALAFLGFLCFAGCAYAATTLDLRQTQNSVEFLAVGRPSALKIRGKLGNKEALNGILKVSEGKLTGDASLQLDALETGIRLRDEHMKDKYLQTKEHPVATLQLDPIALGGSQSGEARYEGPFSGRLRLHGVERPITGSLNFMKTPGGSQGEFRFDIELANFGIETPAYLGITVSKTVQVEAVFRQ